MNNTSRIAFVSNTSWSMYNFRIEVLRSLMSFGVEVYVVAPRDEYSVKLISEGINFIPLHMDKYGTNPLKDLLLTLRLVRIYHRHRFDHIFHYTIKPNLYGSMAAWICSSSSTAITTGLGRMFQFKNPFVNFVSKRLYQVAGWCTKEMWFLNERDRNTFLQHALVSENKTFILPSEGVNCSKFKSLNKKKTTPITRFLFAGRLLNNKGIREFVEAARIIKAQFSKVRFEILGFLDEHNKNSISREELSLWHKQGIIKYLGATEDVRPFIDRCDCVVFPSYYQEGISRVLLEASSMSKPVITTNTEGCRQVIVNGLSGMICRPQSVEDLVVALIDFLYLPRADREIMGQYGRSRVLAKYEVGKIVDIYFKKLRDYCQPPELTTAIYTSSTVMSLDGEGLG